MADQTKQHLPWLDWIRFGAALLVVCVHSRQASFVKWGDLPAADHSLLAAMAFAVTRLGAEAVITFFVLSGYLVGGRALERLVAGTFRPMDYAIDRVARIMLPLLPALALTATISLIIAGHFSVVHLAGNILSLQGILVPCFEGNAPLWSLSYEVWFYVLAGAVGVAAMHKNMRAVPYGMILLVGLVFTVLDSVYLLSWLIGAMAYIRKPVRFSWVLLGAGVCVGLYAIASLQLQNETPSMAGVRGVFPPVGASRILLATGMALCFQQVCFLSPRKLLTTKLEKLGTTLAAFSYTLYLTHYPLLHLFDHFGLPPAKQLSPATIGLFLLRILCSIVLAWILYLLFERHTPFVRGKLKRWLGQPVVPQTAVLQPAPCREDATPLPDTTQPH